MTDNSRQLHQAILIPLLLLACGDSTESDIESAMAGGEAGEAGEEAMMRLSLATADVIPAVIEAIGAVENEEAGRVLLIELLRRIYVRESDPRILSALTQLSQDSDTEIRTAVIAALGDIGQTEQLLWLIDHLGTEEDESVLLVCLESIATLGEWKIVSQGGGFWVPGDAHISRDHTVSLQNHVRRVHQSAERDTVRLVAEELLEKLVCQEVQQGEERELKVDLEGAHRHFSRAL